MVTWGTSSKYLSERERRCLDAEKDLSLTHTFLAAHKRELAFSFLEPQSIRFCKKIANLGA
jgi:hypothetical protein